MVRSISWKISSESLGKIDKIESARNAISETPYDFLPKVQRQHFIINSPQSGLQVFFGAPPLGLL